MYIESVAQKLSNESCKSKSVKIDNCNDNNEQKEEEDEEYDTSTGHRFGLEITGQLGQVMRESSSIALTYARNYLKKNQPGNNFFDNHIIHTHCPAGSIKKDGPSAGVALVSSLLSLAYNEPVLSNASMTGEISLTGKVMK